MYIKKLTSSNTKDLNMLFDNKGQGVILKTLETIKKNKETELYGYFNEKQDNQLIGCVMFSCLQGLPTRTNQSGKSLLISGLTISNYCSKVEKFEMINNLATYISKKMNRLSCNELLFDTHTQMIFDIYKVAEIGRLKNKQTNRFWGKEE